MNRVLARLVFAFAAGSAALAASGVAVPAHQMPAGTPRDHTMPLGDYRFGFLMDSADHRAMAPAMAAVHRALTHAGVSVAMDMPTPEMSGAPGGPVLHASVLDPVQDLGLALALLTVLTPRLVRPTRRLIAVLTSPVIGLAQWCLPAPPVPPRALARPAAAV